MNFLEIGVKPKPFFQFLQVGILLHEIVEFVAGRVHHFLVLHFAHFAYHEDGIVLQRVAQVGDELGFDVVEHGVLDGTQQMNNNLCAPEFIGLGEKLVFGLEFFSLLRKGIPGGLYLLGRK